MILIRSRIDIKSGVIFLVIINVIIFLFNTMIDIPVSYNLLENLIAKGKVVQVLAFKRYGLFTAIFSLFPALIKSNGWVWQMFTYMFLHGNFLHLFFNMYALYIFGKPVEERWGVKEFLFFYMFTGVGAGIITFLWNVVKNPFIPTIGASGAIFGVILAFGLEFPEAVLLLFFVIPVKAKYAAVIFGGIELLMIITGSMKGIGHFTHLAGLLFGYIYYVIRIKNRYRRRSFGVFKNIKGVFKDRTSLLSDHKKERENRKAIEIRDKIKNGVYLLESEKSFLAHLKESYKRENMEMCNIDEFNLEAEYCKNCDYYYACLYRYILH